MDNLLILGKKVFRTTANEESVPQRKHWSQNAENSKDYSIDVVPAPRERLEASDKETLEIDQIKLQNTTVINLAVALDIETRFIHLWYFLP